MIVLITRHPHPNRGAQKDTRRLPIDKRYRGARHD